jgi:tRNA pseudouridine38-40 synthase
MPRYRVILEYDGTPFVGWQVQAQGASVQGRLTEAIAKFSDETVSLRGAGRTDAGVHALGQVAAFTLNRSLPVAAVVRAINARLPAAIRVLSAEEVSADFQPRFAACDKTYRYRIWNADTISPFESRYAWHIAAGLDLAAMQSAAALLVGGHDFAAFQAAGSPTATTQREIMTSVIAVAEQMSAAAATPIDGAHRVPRDGAQPDGVLIVYDVTGNGFLRHMVRTIVGTLVEVGHGRQPVEWVARVLAARDRSMAGPTAPPQGLFLMRVGYDALLADRP